MPKSGKSKRTAAMPAATKKTIAKSEETSLFGPQKRNFGIGGAIQPRRDLSRMLKWPRYIRIQRQRKVLKMRLKVPPSIAQFGSTMDLNSGAPPRPPRLPIFHRPAPPLPGDVPGFRAGGGSRECRPRLTPRAPLCPQRPTCSSCWTNISRRRRRPRSSALPRWCVPALGISAPLGVLLEGCGPSRVRYAAADLRSPCVRAGLGQEQRRQAVLREVRAEPRDFACGEEEGEACGHCARCGTDRGT